MEKEENSEISKFREMSYTLSRNEPTTEHDVDKDKEKSGNVFILLDGTWIQMKKTFL